MAQGTNVVLGVLSGLGVAALGAHALVRRSRELDLVGAKVLITGGSRGLGFATARAFLRRGADVAICARNAAELHRAERELERECESIFPDAEDVDAASFGSDEVPVERKTRPQVLALACDVTNPTAVTRLVNEVLESFGRIDVLVNCAAEIVVAPVDALTATDFQMAMQRIFFTIYHPTMAVLPRMSTRGVGRIVNVTSFSGRMAQPHLASYVAAKHAATGFSETLAIEARKHGVRVTTVTPPPLRNASFLNAKIKGHAEQELLWFAKSLTSRFMSIDPERAANAIVDAARFGDAARSVSPLSWLSTRLYALAPGLAVSVMSAIERRALPGTPSMPAYARRASDVAAHSVDPALRAAVDRAGPAAERYLQPTTSH